MFSLFFSFLFLFLLFIVAVDARLACLSSIQLFLPNRGESEHIINRCGMSREENLEQHGRVRVECSSVSLTRSQHRPVVE